MASRLKSFEVPRSILETPGAFPLDSADLQTVGTSAPQSLSAAVRARKDEFTRKKTIKIKVGSWNVASLSGTDKDLGLWFVKGFGVKGLSDAMAKLQPESSPDVARDRDLESVEDQEERRKKKEHTVPKNDSPAVPHGDDIGLYVLGLQEVVDIASVTEAMKPYTDPNPARKWKDALRSCLPPEYEKVATHQLLGLLVLVFASPEVAPTISNVSCTSVGTGLMGYLGNKGAVCVRIVLGESTKMTFINCHLAAGADDAALQRRIWDTNQILHRIRFSPVSLDGDESGPEEKIGDEDFAFWFGDLNYRLDDIPGEDVRRLLLLHTRNEYDVLNKSRAKIDSELGYISSADNVSLSDGPEPLDHYEINELERPATNSDAEPPLDPESDPASLITTIKSLMAHDQLHAQQRQKKAFHEGWREGEIRFLPTYKYDVGSVGMFDSGEKKRSPSWCDRILFRTRTDRLIYEERAAKEAEVRKKDEEMQKRGLDQSEDQDVLFDYDPDTDGLAYGDDYDEDQDSMNDAELVETHDGHEDEIQCDHYISHQRVLSSDHKPIDCTFTVTYDAVVPDLKAKIHAEVARELDKAENEARPTITVVTENHTDSHSDAGDAASSDNITPTTSSDVNCINFGQIRYDVPKTRSITIANTGQLPAKFNFVGRDADSSSGLIAPTWLTISSLDPNSPEHAEYAAPSTDYTLSPGDTHTLHLTAHISSTDSELVEQLNASAATLDDVLILRVASGRDHFLPLRAVWLPTCFHRSLDELVVAPPTGVRSMPRRRNNRDATGTDGVKSSPGSGPGRNSAPRELFALTEAVQMLTERAVADWEMVHPDKKPPWIREKNAADVGAANGWPFAKETWILKLGQERDEMKTDVREALDTAKPIQECFDPNIETAVRLEIVAETLVEFLASVRGGIVTPEMWTQIQSQLGQLDKDKQSSKEGAITSEETLSTVTDILASRPVHSVSLTFITFMLGRLMGEIAPYPKQKELQSHKISDHADIGESSSVRRSESSSKRSQQSSTMSSAATTVSSDSAIDVQNEPTTPLQKADSAPSSAKAKAATFLTKLTSRRRGTSVSSSAATTIAGEGEDNRHISAAEKERETAAIHRRKAVMAEYTIIVAPLIMRYESSDATDIRKNASVGSGRNSNASAAKKSAAVADKQRKVAEKMMVKVMLGVLEGSVFNI